MRFNRILISLLCLSVLLFCSCGRAAAVSKHESEEADASFLDSLTFLGDSTTAHMLSRAPLRDGAGSKQIWATKSRYLNLSSRITYEKIVCPQTSKEMTIAETAAAVRPPYLVITLGIDYGVYYYRNDQKTFALYYEKLIDAIAAASPDTVIVLQSIFPVGRGSSVITNEMVDRANVTIAEIAARRNLVFVDASTPLKDNEGYLAPVYCYSEDGIHLTRAAYEVIFENLKKYECEIKGEK